MTNNHQDWARVRSTTATATVCNLVELDVSIYEDTLLLVRDEEGNELLRVELGAGAFVKAMDAHAAQ